MEGGDSDEEMQEATQAASDSEEKMGENADTDEKMREEIDSDEEIRKQQLEQVKRKRLHLPKKKKTTFPSINEIDRDAIRRFFKLGTDEEEQIEDPDEDEANGVVGNQIRSDICFQKWFFFHL
jgi:hypothetical protein